MEDIIVQTSNEQKEFTKPKIDSGEYEFKVYDIKVTGDKSRINFILEIEGQIFEEEPVRLVWSAPKNEEYTANSKVGQLLLSMGFDLGSAINLKDTINMVGNCIVQDYSKQVNGKTLTYSIIGDMIVPEEEPVN